MPLVGFMTNSTSAVADVDRVVMNNPFVRISYYDIWV